MVPSVGAQAEPESDHLKCYEVTKDSNPKNEEFVNLFNEFETDGLLCQLITRAALFCTPTAKFRLDETDPSGDDPRGPRLRGDMLCYKIGCERRKKGTAQVEDQFGHEEREIQFKDVKLLCTPAQEPKS
jgi:hypothetical protein